MMRVFENRVLTNILVPNTEELRMDWGKLHNETLHELCLSPNTSRLIKSRRMW
jgi:hypothetical protein